MPRLVGIDKTGLTVGTIFKVGSAGVPPGALRCDGSSVLISDFPFLAAALFDSGTGFYAFGSVDGLHFNLPPNGVFYRDVDTLGNDPDSATRTASATGGNTGANVGSFQADQVGPHSHGIPVGGLAGYNPPIGPGSAPANRIAAGSDNTNYWNLTAQGGNQANPKNVYATHAIAYI